MEIRAMVIAMLINNIESTEKEIEKLETALKEKREKLETYYDLFNELKRS